MLCFLKDRISQDVLFSGEGHLQLICKSAVGAGDLVSGVFPPQGANVGVLNCSGGSGQLTNLPDNAESS